MAIDGKIFMDHEVSFYNKDSEQFINGNLLQKLKFPKAYPAFIQVHKEHPAQSVPMHWHPDSELIYSRNKTITIVIDGAANVLMPGNFALISSYSLHSIIPASDDIQQDVLSISFCAEYLENIWPNITKMQVCATKADVSEPMIKKMRDLCEQLRIHIEESKNNAMKHFETNQLLFSILQLMYNSFAIAENSISPKQLEIRNKLVNILAYIECNYKENLTTQSVADHFGYRREYFCRLFKTYSNQTFKQYLTELRMGAVVREMKTSNRNIGSIALEHGFPDEKSFFCAFKKIYHMTPGQYIASQ